MPAISPCFFRNHVSIVLLLCAATSAPYAFAQSQPPVVVIDSTGFDFYSAYTVSATEWRGPAFTTGTVPTRITEITIGLANTDPATSASLSLFQLDDSTELPIGTPLATASLPIVNGNEGTNLSANTYTTTQLGTIPSTTLLASKKYALILSSPSGGYIGLSDNNGPGNAYSYAAGYSVAAQGYLQTVDSGSLWTQNNSVTPAIKLTVVPVDDPIVEPPAAPKPVPGLGAVGLVSLVSVIGILGLRRSRKSV